MKTERKHICKVCGKEFTSKTKKVKTCSHECRMAYLRKTPKVKKVGTCEWCNKEFQYTTSKRRPVHRFCSQNCRHKYRGRYVKEHGNLEETKNKISKTLKGKSLKDRGYSEDAIQRSVNAIKIAGQEWNDSIKGKTYEEIHGERKAKEIKNKFNRKGKNNSFYGKHHTVETKNKIVRNRKGKFHSFASGVFNNIRWQGSYELQFLIDCYENNIKIKRYDLDPIEYKYKGVHHYYPDFIVDDNLIIECKGYANEQNLKKIESGKNKFGEKFKVFKKTDYPLKLVPDKDIDIWYKKLQKSYKDILIIKHNPHKGRNKSGKNKS